MWCALLPVTSQLGGSFTPNLKMPDLTPITFDLLLLASAIRLQSLGYELETLEEEIVWDADKVDLIGVTGVLRAFHWAGAMKVSFKDEVKWFRERQTKFYDQLKTETAKAFAKKRHDNMICYLGVLENELILADLHR